MRLIHYLWALGLIGGTLPAMESAAGRRIIELRAEIAHHDELYFKQAAPEIADADYDRLKRELAALERAHPELAVAKESVGDDRTGRFPGYVHRERMLSLDKVYAEAEWRTWHAGVAARLGRRDFPFVVEPKYDGLAISLTYDHGRLVRAATRGDGREGDDVTANVRTIEALPTRLAASAPDGSANPIPDLVELRGEIYIEDAEFERINAERLAAGEEPFANPRNLAAGTLKSADAGEAGLRQLSIVLYGWGAWEGPGLPATQRQLHERIRAWGLPGVNHVSTGRSAAEGWAAIQQLGRERGALGFPIDGAVMKLDDVPARALLGENDHTPRWAIAYKYEPEQVIARIRAISLQIGRTGMVTPVAELDSVSLGGSTVRRATLHNRAAIARRDIRVGDYVSLEKAGEIIPAVLAVQLDRRPPGTKPYAFPTRCPACDATLEANPGEAAVRCPNPDCPAQVQRRLEHFASAQAVNIAGLGPATLAALVESGRVRTPADLYRLRETDLVSLKGIGPRSAAQLLRAIERSKQSELWRVVYGLSIPGLGKASARKLALECADLEGLLRIPPERLGVLLGKAAAGEAAAYLARPENAAMIGDLAASRLP